ncbi:MAG: TolC family outer membrane protein [Panacagrimonas sp.]
MKALQRLLFTVATCAAAAPVSANELNRVYTRALQNDSVLQAAQHARDAQLERRPQARAALLPQLGASYSYSEGDAQGSTTQIGTNQGQDFVIASQFDSDSSSESFGLSLNQVIFDWAAFRSYAIAGDQLALAQAVYREAEQALILRVTRAYFDLLAADDNLRFARAENKAVERQLEQATRRFEVGFSAITDVQEAQARFDLTVAREIQARQLLANAHQALRVITGPQDNRVAKFRADIPLPTPDPLDPDAWARSAQENNLDLLAARLSADIARKGIGVAQAGHLPTVGLRGSYTDADDETGDRSQQIEADSIGITVNLPLFSGFAVRSRVREASAVHEQSLAQLETVSRSVDQLTRDAYLGVMAGAARVRALKQAVVSSRTALEASQTGLEVGTRTAVDVLNSQRDLYNAQTNHARARYDFLLAVLTLKSAAGQLKATDLNQIDALLDG